MRNVPIQETLKYVWKLGQFFDNKLLGTIFL